MARIPESEIERLKLQVSVVRLVEAAGIALKPHGGNAGHPCITLNPLHPQAILAQNGTGTGIKGAGLAL